MKESTAFGSVKEMNKPAFGIDLGTTNSCIGVVGNSDYPNIVGLDSGKVTMPSCVLWDSNTDTFIVGEEAYKNRYKSNACYSVKRKMGSGEVIKLVHNGKRLNKTPAEISAIILKSLVEKASTNYKDINDVIITVPADFTTPQIKDTALAAEIAGLNVLQIMKEPTAASLVYKLDKEPGNVMVYDLGGGTFDVSVVSITKGSGESDLLNLLDLGNTASKDAVTVIATRGDSSLGGDDLDHYLYEVIESRMKEMGCDVSKIQKEDKEKLILKLENFKKIDNFFEITVEANFTLKGGKKFNELIPLTCEDFKECTRKLFNKTKPFIDDVIRTSKLNISAIVLVGGSTKNSYLRELLELEYPDTKIYKYLNPDESVALGAAVQAKRIKFGSDTLEVFDITSNPIGILADGVVVKIVDKNQSIPFTNERTFSTSIDNQESVSIEVYEGSGLYAKENTYLGNLVISGIPKHKAGEVGVTVSLSVDSSGLLSCRSKAGKGEWKSIKLLNILGRKVEETTKDTSIMFDRWYRIANSLEDPRKQELISLIEESRIKPSSTQNVVKFISKVLAEKKEAKSIKDKKES